MIELIPTRGVAANDEPFALQRGPFIDHLNSLHASGAVGQVDDSVAAPTLKLFPNNVDNGRSARAEALEDVREHPFVVVSVFEIAERGIEIQHRVKSVRAHERAHVRSDELGCDENGPSVLARLVKEKRGEIDTRYFKAFLCERNGVAPRTAAKVEHPTRVIAAQSQQTVDILCGASKRLAREHHLVSISPRRLVLVPHRHTPASNRLLIT